MLRVEVKRRGLPFAVVAAGCNGMCWAQPVAEVLRDGRPRLTTGPVTAAEAPRLLNALAANPAAAPDVGRDWLARQRRRGRHGRRVPRPRAHPGARCPRSAAVPVPPPEG